MKCQEVGSANGNRTRISALKGPRANRCTIAPNSVGTTYKSYQTGENSPNRIGTDPHPKLGGCRNVLATKRPASIYFGGPEIPRAKPSEWLRAWLRWKLAGHPQIRGVR